jgi:hypothetical protein
MFGIRRRTDRPRGQILALFALTLTVLILGVGLVVDGGNALVQRRASQNAADFAALAGARIIAEKVGGDLVTGTDANVQLAITNAIQTNGGATVTFGSPSGPRYIDDNGALLGFVGANPAIPATAAGVKLSSTRSWRPYFLGIIGISNWSASADATATGGFCVGCTPEPGTLFPAGISLAFFQTYPDCAGLVSNDPASPCYPQNLTPGNLNVPGGFGWLSYGCDGYGLGQVAPANIGGCGNNSPFLQDEMGPPSKSYGCCTAVGVSGLDQIGSVPGNKVDEDCSYYINTGSTVTVPIWDTAGDTGSNAWYHIVGFAGFQITGCSGGKNLEGVWRRAFFPGPTSTTAPAPGVPSALGVELVH